MGATRSPSKGCLFLVSSISSLLLLVVLAKSACGQSVVDLLAVLSNWGPCP